MVEFDVFGNKNNFFSVYQGKEAINNGSGNICEEGRGEPDREMKGRN